MDLNYNIDYTFRVPNSLIRNPDLNKKTLLTYIHIHRQRLYEGGSALFLEMLIQESGYTVGQRHRPISKQFKEALQYLSNQKLIVLPRPVDDYSIREYIGVELLPDFIPTGNYTQVSVREITTMLDNRSGVDPANLVATYLFIKSRIGSYELTLCCTQEMMASELALSVRTIQQCCSCLEKLGLMCVHNGVYVQSKGKRVYMPNIYAIKRPGWQEALSETIKNIEASYNVSLAHEEGDPAQNDSSILH